MKLNLFKTLNFSKSSFFGALKGLLCVPLFYLMLNLNRESSSLFEGMLISTRIGFVVTLICYIFCHLSYAFFTLLKFNLQLQLRGSVLFMFGNGVAGMLLGLVTASVIEDHFFNNQFNIQGISTGLLIGSITYLAFLLLSAYRETQNYNLKLRAESAEANLNVLKNQMQPHFLFNSLNSLAELIDSNRDYASQMTQKLSDLYREILESSQTQKSTLHNEISIVKKYLDLESLRFGQRLKYTLQVPDHTVHILVPSLILQTLVENAVKHGIAQSLEGGHILLDIQLLSEGYLVKIENTVGQTSVQSQNSTGHGLKNTKDRLQLFYPDRHQFNISIGQSTTLVSFWISGV